MMGCGHLYLSALRARDGVTRSEISRVVREKGGYLAKRLGSKTTQHMSFLSFDVGLVLCRRFPKDLHSPRSSRQGLF